MAPGELLTCGFYSENDLNFVAGTNQGSVFFLKKEGTAKSKQDYINYCRIPNLSNKKTFTDTHHQTSKLGLNGDLSSNDNDFDLEIKREDSQDGDCEEYNGITSIHFLPSKPIAVMLVAFDDAKCSVWKSVVENEQQMRIKKLQRD